MLCMSVTIFHGKFWMAFDYIRNINVFIVVLAKAVLVGSSAVCTCKVISIWVVSSSSRASIRFCLVTHSTKCIRNEVLGVFCQIPPWLFVGCLGTQVHSFLAKQMSVAYLLKWALCFLRALGRGFPSPYPHIGLTTGFCCSRAGMGVLGGTAALVTILFAWTEH